jgi:regulatory protein
LTAAVEALRRRERTVDETRSWLLERGFDRDPAEEAVAELIELGELDDERFAAAFATDKRDLAGWGSERILATLRGRGVDPAVAEAACAEPREAELERAARQLAARAEELEDDGGRGRALAYLTRRGYEYELAYDAIRLAMRDRAA